MVLRWYFDGSSKDFRGFSLFSTQVFPLLGVPAPPDRRSRAGCAQRDRIGHVRILDHSEAVAVVNHFSVGAARTA